MKKISILLILTFLISACSTMQPPRYAVSVDNIQELKKLEGSKIQVTSLTQPEKISVGCRLMGPIEPADGLSFGEFISKAFNDEFKMAEIYSTQGINLSGDITTIKFSSMNGLTNGNWEIALTLNSSNGESMSISNKYKFKSGFDAVTACNATADALSSAVQDLIKTTIQDPNFKRLIQPVK